MRDPHYKEFAGRLRRIDKIHRKGGGFEADGTLGQSHYTAENRERRSLARPTLVVVGLFVGYKGLLLASLGEANYMARVARLETGTTGEQIGAFLMRIDPLSGFFGNAIAPLIG